MDRFKAGIDKFRKQTGQAAHSVGDKVIRQAFHADGASLVKDKFVSRRQYAVKGRVVEEVKQISEGGFAFVWRVRDTATQEEFALKKMLCQDKAMMTLARREVELLERLPVHPNLVRYYGCATDEVDQGRSREVSLLFELCPGGHLLHLLDQHQGKLGEQRVLHVFLEVVTGVAVLHAQAPPIAHRDLKVENVLLGSDGRFKLCDFGSWTDQRSDVGELDRLAVAALQEQIERYTTMMYRPPEMVDFYQQQVISEKVDIWMLGCVLFTLMFYRHPFQDESSLAIANARYHMSSSPEYSERLQDLVHWLLARNPDDRPSADFLLDVLRQFDAGGGSLPLPPAVVERIEKDRRLYHNDRPPRSEAASGSGSASPQARSPEGQKKAERRQHKKKEKAAAASAFGDVWSQPFDADAPVWPGAGATPWGALAAAAPADPAWAPFDAAAGGGAPAWPAEAARPLAHSGASSRSGGAAGGSPRRGATNREPPDRGGFGDAAAPDAAGFWSFATPFDGAAAAGRERGDWPPAEAASPAVSAGRGAACDWAGASSPAAGVGQGVVGGWPAAAAGGALGVAADWPVDAVAAAAPAPAAGGDRGDWPLMGGDIGEWPAEAAAGGDVGEWPAEAAVVGGDRVVVGDWPAEAADRAAPRDWPAEAAAPAPAGDRGDWPLGAAAPAAGEWPAEAAGTPWGAPPRGAWPDAVRPSGGEAASAPTVPRRSADLAAAPAPDVWLGLAAGAGSRRPPGGRPTSYSGSPRHEGDGERRPRGWPQDGSPAPDAARSSSSPPGGAAAGAQVPREPRGRQRRPPPSPEPTPAVSRKEVEAANARLLDLIGGD